MCVFDYSAMINTVNNIDQLVQDNMLKIDISTIYDSVVTRTKKGKLYQAKLDSLVIWKDKR